MASLGKAYIEVHADTSPFGKELRKDLDKYLATADKQMAKAGTQHGKTYSKSFESEASKGFDTALKDFRTFSSKVTSESRGAGSRLGRGLRTGLRDFENDTSTTVKRVSGYFSSLFTNATTGIQSWTNSFGKLVASGLPGLATMAALLDVIVALIFAAIPLVDALAGALIIGLGGSIAAVAFLLAPIILAFHQLSAILPDLTASQKKFNAQLKLLPDSLKPLAEVLRTIALAIKNLPLGDFVKEIVPPLQVMAKFFQSKAFRTAFSQLADDAGRLVADLLYMFETPNAGKAFLTFMGTVHQVFLSIRQVVEILGGAIANVFNDPGVQLAIQRFADLISTILIDFAGWLNRVSTDGSLDQFLNDALMILGDMFTILQQVMLLFLTLASPENMKNLHEFLLFIATLLHEITGYLASKEGQRFMRDLYIGLELAISTATVFLILMFAISAAIHDIGVVGKAAWSGIQKFGIAALDSLISMVNTLIGGINHLIDLLDHIGAHIPHIPKIPKIGGGGGGGHGAQTGTQPAPGAQTGTQPPAPTPILGHGLAEGDIIRQPTIALMGEQNRPEVVIPLTNPQRARQLANESGLSGQLYGQQMVTVVVNLDGAPFRAYTAAAFDAVGHELTTGTRP